MYVVVYLLNEHVRVNSATFSPGLVSKMLLCSSDRGNWFYRRGGNYLGTGYPKIGSGALCTKEGAFTNHDATLLRYGRSSTEGC